MFNLTSKVTSGPNLVIQGVVSLTFCELSKKILSKFVYCTNSTYDENFNLKLRTCNQCLALGTRTHFQIEILTINVISRVVYFRQNILGSSRNVSETAPWLERLMSYRVGELVIDIHGDTDTGKNWPGVKMEMFTLVLWQLYIKMPSDISLLW